MRGCFVGSGSEGMQQVEVCSQVIALARKPPAEITVLYLGTATYDLPLPKHNQTMRFAELGCKVVDIRTVGDCTPPAHFPALCAMADVIVVSGGNTLWAIDKWTDIGLVPYLAEAAQRGVVLTGGSAGAICWFDGGHSDSMDAATFKGAMVVAAPEKDESSSAPTTAENCKKWDYIRCPCLGFLPGLVCPHADRVQSNGILRNDDFEDMLRRHSGERGICIDHFAALCIDGDDYWVLSLPNQLGSVLPDGSFSRLREGVPGVWIKDVVGDTVVSTLCPQNGKIDCIFKVASEIVSDPRLSSVRAANPIH